MSRVTNVILTAHVGPHDDADHEIASVNNFLREADEGGGGQFIEVTRHAGGTKHMECRVYVSAFNHADTASHLACGESSSVARQGNGSGVREGTGRREIPAPLQWRFSSENADRVVNVNACLRIRSSRYSIPRLLDTPMNAAQNRPRTRFLSFMLEAAKLFGIAIVCLLVIAVAAIVSVKTGFTVPARWFGLFYWTCALLWFVFRQHKRDLRYGRFWLALSAFLMVHVTAFTIVLRAYAAWRAIWFMFVFMIEGPLVLVALANIVHPRHNRRHV